jgi:hypothetical protein
MIQGILVTGAAVYSNQLFKKAKKDKRIQNDGEDNTQAGASAPVSFIFAC